MLSRLLTFLCATFSFSQAFVVALTSQHDVVQGNFSVNDISHSNLSDPIDPRIRVVQRLSDDPIDEIQAYMVNLVALWILAKERYTGTAAKERQFAAVQYPDVRMFQEFRNPVQRKILFLSFLQILQSFANYHHFVRSANEIFWTDRSLGWIYVVSPETGPLLSTDSISLRALADENPTNEPRIIIDRSRANLSREEIYLCSSIALWAVAQERAEETYQPFTVSPDDYDVSLEIEEPLSPHTRQLTWGEVDNLILHLADMISRGIDGGKFAELYGRIKVGDETVAQWKLQRGRPVNMAGTASAHGVDLMGLGAFQLLGSNANRTVVFS